MPLNYPGVITRPDITGLPTETDSGIYHSLKVVTNFENTKIAVSDDYNGKVTIYNYTSNNNTWNFEHELYSGSTESSNGFGVSLTMDWDAERIAVGANVLSKVYTFDYENGAWSSTPRVINGNPGSDFGYSISMAANDKRLLCIGAPLENKVYVYNDVQSSWNQVYVNDGTDIISRVPLSPNSNIIMKSQYNAYGYHVYMSSSGSRVIVGAPGAVLQRITTNDILYIETAGVLSLPATGLDYGYEFDASASSNGLIPGLLRFVGNARVILRNGDTWSQQSSGQYGNDIEGDPEKFVLTNPGNDPLYSSWNTLNTTSGWCMPAFGSCTHIKDDELIITVSSPTHSPGGDRAFFSGKISRFIFDEDTFKWVPYGLEILSRFTKAMYGDSFVMDYSGDRIVIGTQVPFQSEISGLQLLTGRVHVLEWNKTSWYEVQELILLEDNGLGYPNGYDKVNVAVTNGKNAFCTSVRQGKLYTKDFNLTQVFVGNNLFTGYVASDIYRVGANNGDDSNTTEKKIVFGGTRGDQSYEYTSIENRSLSAAEHSELLLFKRSGGNQNTDILRIKANEIHLDNYLNGDIITRAPDDPSLLYISSYDSKTIHRPSIVINWRGSTCITPHIRQDLSIMRKWYGNENSSAPDYNFSAASCDSKAALDVNGDVYIRNRLNINDMDRNKMIGTWVAEPQIFYNTRDIDVFYRDPVDSNRILVKSETRPFQFTLVNLYGIVEGTVNYLTEYRGFEFVGSGKITNVLNGTGQATTRTSFWINLKNDQSTYPDSDIFYIASSELYRTLATSVTFQITSSGIKILYKQLKSPFSSFSFTSSHSFQKNKWYNIQVQLPSKMDVIPQATTESENLTYVAVWVDTVQKPLTINGTAFVNYFGFNKQTHIVGGNTENIIVGMFMFWVEYAFSDDTYPNVVDSKLLPIQNAYKYGHPSEMLVVGGDATVSGKLGIGVTNPTEALEVSGNVHANYFVGDGSELSNITLQAVTDSGNVTSNTVQFTNTGTSLVTSGKIGLGTTNPTTTLDVNGNAQTNVGYIHRTIVIRDANGGFTDVGPQGTLDLGTLQSGVSFHSTFRSPMIQRGVQGNFIPGDGASWEGNHVIIGFRYVSINTGLTGSTIPFRVYSNNYQTTTFTYYSWTTADDGFERGYMSTTSPPLIQNTGDVPSIWLQNQSTTNTVRINAIWMEYVNI